MLGHVRKSGENEEIRGGEMRKNQGQLLGLLEL
jgi:hypothetical protein